MMKASHNNNTRLHSNTCQRFRLVLTHLLQEKEIDKISVTELCQTLQTNRSTFYAYYDDIYDLLQDIEQAFLARFEQLCHTLKVQPLPPETVTVMIMRFLAQHREALTVFRRSDSYAAFFERVNALQIDLFTEKLNQENAHLENLNPDYVHAALQFISAGFYNVYLHWLDDHCREDIQKLAKQCVLLSQACLRGLFDKNDREVTE